MGIGGKIIAGLVAFAAAAWAIVTFQARAKQAGRDEVNRQTHEQREENRETADRIADEPSDADAARERLRNLRRG